MKLETIVETLNKTVETGFTEIKNLVKDNKTNTDAKICELDETKAEKTDVEKITKKMDKLIWTIITVGGTIIGFLVKYIFFT